MGLINEFINYLKSEKNPSKATVKNYKADVRKFVEWFDSKFKKEFTPEEISAQTIEAYKSDKLDVSSLSPLSARSLDRHLSSLRKFFTFLKLEGYISASPFDETASANEAVKNDPWHLKEFKNYLYVYNAANLTIKNYIIDVRQFFTWAEQVTGINDAWEVSDRDIFSKIDNSTIETYKERLLKQGLLGEVAFSPATVNRKLSSLRRYFAWAKEEGLIKNSNLVVPNAQLEKQIAPDLELLREHAKKLAGENIVEDKNKEYSKFPPIRLAQKTFRGAVALFDAALVMPLVVLTKKTHFLFWKAKGKPVFQVNQSLVKDQKQVERLRAKIRNLPKRIYAPLNISTRYFPWYKKAYFHIRYTRPNWYKTYRSYPITNYFHLSILIIIMSIIGFSFYSAFIAKPNKQNPVLASGTPVSPLKILSFQGRITDASNNPITSATYLRFTIYNQLSGTDPARLWEEVDKITPDTDGIFSILLGSDGAGGNAAACGGVPPAGATGACGIPESLFAQNSALWLGVTVGNTIELTPRQQLATVAFATNAETLQGMPPITSLAAGDAKTNTVLALDSSGNLTIGGSTNPAPVFQATSGQFTLTGKTLVLGTVASSNTNVQIAPDGSGYIDLQKPLINTTNNNNISTAKGSVEVDDLFSVLATSSGQSAVTINQTGTGPLISASTSGVAKFTVDNSGNTSIAGNAVVSGNLSVVGSVATSLIPTGTIDLGSSGSYWNNLYVNNIIGAPSGTQGYWQRNSGAISPANITDDLLVGGISTTSAKFAFGVLNVAKNQPVASVSGNLVVMQNNGWGGNVGIGTSAPGARLDVAGNVNFQQYATVGASLNVGYSGFFGGVGNAVFSGNVGIGTTNPQYPLDVNGTIRVTSCVGCGGNANYWNLANGLLYPVNSTVDFAVGGNSSSSANFLVTGASPNEGTLVTASVSGQTSFAALVVDNSGLGDLITASSSGTPASGRTQFRVTNGGSVYARSFFDLDNPNYFLDPAATGISLTTVGAAGIGTTNPIGLLQITGNTNSNGLVNINQTGIGNIFTASASGATKFVIGNAGNVGIGTTVPVGLLNLSGAMNSNALEIINQTGLGDIWTASSGGTSRFTIGNTGNVGIGTTTPVGLLNINGTAGTTALMAINETGTTNDIFVASQGGTPKFVISNGGDVNIARYATVGASLNVGYNGVLGGTGNAAFSGNVGIGTTNPSHKLYVVSNVTGVSAGYFRGGTGGTSPVLQVDVGNGAGSPAIDLVGGATTFPITIRAGQFGMRLSTQNGGSIFFMPSGSGNVGVGTTNPVGLFNVTGSTSNKNALTILNETGTNDIFTASSGGTPRFTISNSGNVGIATTLPVGLLNVSGTMGNTALVAINETGAINDIFVASQGGNPKFIIANSGNVGIGTTNTGSYALNVNGTINVSSCVGCAAAGVNYWTLANGLLYPGNLTTDFAIGGSSTGSAKFVVSLLGTQATATVSGNTSFAALNVINSGVGDLFTASAGATTRFVIRNNGNVGIGTNLPIGLLNVNGTMGSTALVAFNESGATNDIFVASQGGSPKFVISNGGDVNIARYATVGASLNVGYNGVLGGTGNAAFSGNVGIGTTNPGAKLQVAGSGMFGQDGGALPANAGAGVRVFYDTFGSANVGSILAYDYGASAARPLILQNYAGGVVGIGTTNPKATLDVAGNVNFQQYATIAASLNVGYNAVLAGTGNGVFSGNVGIGTTNPGSRLQVAGDITPEATGTRNLGSSGLYWNNLYVNNIISASTGIQGFWQRNLGAVSPTNITDDLLVGGVSTTSSTFAFGVLNVAAKQPVASVSGNLVVYQNNGWGGNVGIGTTNPLSKLDVQGDATISGNLIAASGVGTTRSIQSTANNSLTIGGNTTGNILLAPLNSAVGAYVAPSITNQVDLGTANLQFRNIYAQSFIGGLSGIQGYWQRNQGAISPSNITDDLLVGGVSTTSSTFAFGVLNVAAKQPVASVSGNLMVMPNNGFGGNVGIGTTSPQYPLDIINSTNPQLRLGYSSALYSTIGTDNNGNLNLITPNGASAGIDIVSGINANNGANEALTLKTTQTLGNSDELFQIINNTSQLLTVLGSGNVGIGTTQPLGLLQVSGNTGTNGLMNINQLGLGNIFTASVGGTTKFVIGNAGNVGIGTTTPVGLLNVSGSVGNTALVSINQTNGSYDIFTASSGGTPRFLINSLGNVGIGTTLPVGLLNVNGTIGTTALMAVNQTGLYDIFTASSGGTPRFTIGNAGNVGIGTTTPVGLLNINGTAGTTALMTVNQTNGLYDIFTASSGGTPRFTINALGNVGIGTTLPVGGLNVSGVIGSTALVAINQSSGTNDIFVASQAGLPKFVISSTGNVGIGTTSTGGYALNVNGAINVSSCVGCGAASPNYWTLNTGGSNQGILYPGNSTTDFIIGGTSTASADFAVLGINNNQPIASVSGNLVVAPNNGWGGNITTTNGYISSPFGSLGSFQNMLKYSDDFTNAATWYTSNVNVTGDTTVAPDGSLTADTATTTNAGHALYQLVTVSPGATYTFSFWAKQGTMSTVKYSVYDYTHSADIVVATSYSISYGWQRFSVPFTVPAGTTQIYVYPVRDSGTTGTVFVWGAQLIPGGAPGLYVNTVNMPFTSQYSGLVAKSGGFSGGVIIGGNVGIGTNTPVGLLNVSGTIGSTALVTINETGSNNIFVASQGGNPKFVINNSGNVGIGTTNPQYKVEINQPNLGDTDLTLTTGAGNTDALTPLRFKSVNNGGYYEPILETPAALRISSTQGGSTVTQFRLLPYGNDIYFQNTNNIGNIYFTGLNAASVNQVIFYSSSVYSQGNVGIGTTAPTAPLSTVGSTTESVDGLTMYRLSDFQAAAGGNKYIMYGSTATANDGLILSTPNTSFRVDVGTQLQDALLFGSGNSGSGNNTYFSVSRTAATGGNVELDALNSGNGGTSILINSRFGGNVGIGTTNPLYLLDVNGALHVSSCVGCGSVSGTNFWNLVSGLGVAGGGYLSPINSTADLLIGGQATSSAVFAVLGLSNSSHQTTASVSGNLIVMPNNGFGGNVGIGTNNPLAALNVNTQTGFSNIFVASAAGLPKVIINGLGNVGIGTTLPVGLLNVSGTVGTTALMTVNQTNGSYDIFTASAGGTPKFTINGLGNVGIGTTLPVGLLNISGTMNNNALEIISQSGTGDIWTASSSGTPRFIIGNIGNVGIGTTAIGNGQLVINQNNNSGFGDIFSASSAGSTKFTINNLGNVGIGSTRPVGLLYVSGTVGTTALMTVNQTNGSYDIFTASAGGTPKFTINGLGNVGIGTTLPVGLLNISGTIGNTALMAINQTNGSYDIFTASSGGTPKFLINSMGNVGIGTTQPVGLLNISGTIGKNALVSINQTNGSYDIFTASSGGTPKFLINSLGNVGVGTTLPVGLMNITGSMNANALEIVNQTGLGDIWTASSSSVTRLVLTQVGRMGLGTTSPLATLDVRAASNALPIASISGTTAYAGLVVDQAGAAGDIFTASAAGTTRFRIAQNGSIVMQGNTITSVGTGGTQTASGAVINAMGDTGSLIPNPGFESNLIAPGQMPDGWAKDATSSAIAMTQDTTAKAKGNSSLKVLFTNTSGAFYSTCVPLTGTAADTVGYVLNYYQLYTGTPRPTVRAYIDTFAGKGDCMGNTNAHVSAPAYTTPVLNDTNWHGIGSGTTAVVLSSSAGSDVWGKVHFFFHSAAAGAAQVNIDGVRLVQATVGSGTDYAENYPADPNNVPEPGDVVTLESLNGSAVVKPANVPMDQAVIGVVSTNPALVLDDGKMQDPKVPIALSGRIPTKVSTKNGPIQLGDYLTSSDIPGVAVKAIGAGPVIGTAMEDYTEPDTSKIGKIVMFTKNTYYNGVSVANNSGLDLNGKDSAGVLAVLSQAQNLSLPAATFGQIAGLELITPKITTENLAVDTIKASTGKDIMFNLAEGGEVQVKDNNGNVGLSFDGQGNASFAGILTATEIKAGKIDGLDTISGQIAGINDNISALDSSFAVLAASTVSANFSDNSSTSSALVLSSLNVDGLATVSGNLRVKGSTLVEGILNVIDTITTQNLIVSSWAEFLNNVIFKGSVSFETPPIFNSDTAGTVIIKKGADRVDVVFGKEYETVPVITANLSTDQGNSETDADFETRQQQILGEGYTFIVSNRNTKKFTIILNKPAGEDLTFSWVAIAVKDSENDNSSSSGSAQIGN